MTNRTIGVIVAIVVAGIGAIIFALWYTGQREADGKVNMLLDATGTPRRPAAGAPIPDGAYQAMRELERQYVLAANVAPPNPERITEIIRMVRALRRRFPGLTTQLQGV